MSEKVVLVVLGSARLEHKIFRQRDTTGLQAISHHRTSVSH